MIDFPASPVAGQIFFGSNGVAYQYSSTYTSWVPISASAPTDASFHAISTAGNQIAPAVINTWTTIKPASVTSGNVGGYYNSATGVFTPPAGRYFVYGEMSFNSTSSSLLGQMRIRKNGTTPVLAQDDDHTAGANFFTGSHAYAIIDCNGTDQITVETQCSVLFSNAQGQMGAFAINQAVLPIGGGSSWRQIARTVVGVATPTLDFQNIPADINDIEVRFDLLPVNNDMACIMQLFDAGGTIITSGYPWSNVANYNTQAVNASPLASSTSSSAAYTAGIVLNYHAVSNSVMNTSGLQGRATINNIRDAARPKHVLYQSSHLTQAGSYQMQSTGAGLRNANGAISGVRLFFGTGNIAAGSVASLWGSP